MSQQLTEAGWTEIISPTLNNIAIKTHGHHHGAGFYKAINGQAKIIRCN